MPGRGAARKRRSGRATTGAAPGLRLAIRPAGDRRRGFSLIELLVVSAILGLIVFVLAACIAAGVRVWDTARGFNDADTRALFGLAVMEKDVAGALPFGPIPFKGDGTAVSFASPQAADATRPPGITTVRYAFDERRQRLVRSEWPYPDGNADLAGEEGLVSGVSRVRLSYFKPPTGERKGEWQAAWTDGTGFPSRVRIELTLKNKDAETPYERLLFVPCSGAP